MQEEEYELVPLSPIRRMEKRLERLEKSGTSTEMLKEVMDVVKTNQQIVDEMVKMNSELVNRITELTSSVNNAINKIDEFLNRLEVEKPEEGEAAPAAGTKIGDVDKRLERLEKRINSLILSTMARRGMKLKRPVGMQRPVSSV